MIREEAIKAIQDFIGWFKEDSLIRKALEMAIQALSQEPTDTWSIKDVADTFKKHGLIREYEPCDDAISRETVIDTLQYAWEANKDIQESIVEIKALPSVTQKSGKWVEDEFCSVCGRHMLANHPSDMGDYVASKYCPHCGAKMESEE